MQYRKRSGVSAVWRKSIELACRPLCSGCGNKRWIVDSHLRLWDVFWDKRVLLEMKPLSFDCQECGRADSADPSTPRGREELCFRCHVKGVSFKFVGPTGGRESFHSETIASVADETVRAAREQGREVRPKTKVGGTAFTPPNKVAS